MRKAGLVTFLALCVVLAAQAEERLDLLPGANDGDPPTAIGFRVASGGQVVLRVEPAGTQQARVRYPDGTERTIQLPRVKAYKIESPAPQLPAAPAPRFVATDFTTLLDALTLLVSEATPLRFVAVVRLHTDKGPLGRGRIEIAARGERASDAALDAWLERALAANPLPPLMSGTALCEIAAWTDENSKTLHIWLGAPYADDAGTPTPLTDGWWFDVPLSLPAAVTNSRLASTTREVYAREREAAKSSLLSWLAAPEPRALYGQWHWTAVGTHEMAARSLRVAPVGEADAVLFLGALALAHERRAGEAAEWMTQVATGAVDVNLAAMAQRHLHLWKPATPTPDGLPDPVPSGVRRLIHNPQARAAAEKLAREAVELPNPAAADRLHRQLAEADGWADVLLYDTGAILFAQGKYRQAAELWRVLLGEHPLSPLATRAAWDLWRATVAVGDSPLAKEQAAQIARDFAPDSAWSQERQKTGANHWPFPMRVLAPEAVRWQTLRWLRDQSLADFLAARDPEDLVAAEQAGRELLDSLRASPSQRADWLTLGHIFHLTGRRDEARRAYANVALDETEDALRGEALRALAAVLEPDARRVAAALKSDAVGRLLTPVLHE
jgi:tetratricopeptide (TPR) repeat protein